MSRMHEITLDELMTRMNKDIVLASSYDARTRISKDLKFNPAELKYRIRIFDGIAETSNSYHDPLIAIEKYNNYHSQDTPTNGSE